VHNKPAAATWKPQLPVINTMMNGDCV